MGEPKINEENSGKEIRKDVPPKMKISKPARSLESEYLDFPEIPLSVNTIKRPLTSFFPNFLVRWFLTLVRFAQVFFSTGIFLMGYVLYSFSYLFNKEKKERACAKFFVQRFKNLGGAFTKIGQQLALRRDLLPVAYCEELEDLHDKAKAFRFSYTLKVLEELINPEEEGNGKNGKPKRKLSEVFAEINESPIGKASIACVYKAVLVDGNKVAIKVKRPGIERTFAADIFALSMFLEILEFLNIIKTGISANLQSEIREMFTEELNFNIEKRYQDLFRQIMKKHKRYKVSAPKIYFRLSSEKVIVSEFLERGKDGIFMSTFLETKKTKGEAAANALLENFNINPKKVSKRLIQMNHFSFYELPFFHGDPHPGNVFLKPNNQIVLIDFGSCGAFGERERNLMKMMQFYYSKGDVSGMTQSVVSLMEPLPPIDVHSFTKELESEWWQGYYGIISKKAHWTEKTSFRLWSALFAISNRHNVPVPLHMLRMVRATLAYDTVAAGLYPQLNVFKEYQTYFDKYAEKIRMNTNEDIIRQLFFGPDPINYVRLKRAMDLGEEALFRFQQLVRTPVPSFQSITDKVFDLVRFAFQYITRSVIIILLGFGWIFLTIENSETDNTEGISILKGKWDEILIASFNPQNWIDDGQIFDNIDCSPQNITTGSISSSTATKKCFDPEVSTKISRIMSIDVLLILGLTWIYLRKILSRFKDVDTRT